ncbi:MAG: 23S rRNA (pseudouridine(1915)-N(3))-methyltransferase RlmH [Nitrospiraceae bacterium]|nr:23S rRNA (pseudouridine(1915)-N(3))-methyltransferase RlmH [Nitrospiraceae bacterium]
MRIRLIWTGKTKERFIDEGIRKYTGLLRPFADLSITELREEKGREQQRIREREGERILGLKTRYILLDEKGKNMTSLEFADFIRHRAPAVNFMLGGAYGVSEAVKEAADQTIALSRMTFTHELSRLFLLEQIYRAFTIINRRGYHH